jgi:catechol O-methyltransferase
MLHYIYSRPDIRQLRGNPQKVIAAIDDYHSEFNILMNIGATKGAFVTSLIAERKPSVMIELGGYVGYSAILFGDAIRANGGKQFLSIEKNPEVAAVANQLVDLAGLRDIVRILVGASDEVLLELVRDRKEIAEIEMIFIDHWQRLYRPDLWLLEELDVLVPGTSVLVADNVIMPGAPEYLEWVKATTEQKRELVKKLDVGSLTPNPNLVYETTVSEFDTDFGKVGLVPSMDFLNKMLIYK